MATTTEDNLNNWYTAKTATPTQASTGMLGSTQVPTVDPATYKPTTLDKPTDWNVTNDQTVQGQINNIINKDSPLMQQAQTKGLQQANDRGLLNSSMAVNAAQDSVLSAATPIAQADASTYSRAAGYNADTANTFAKTNMAAQNEASNFGAQAINRANEFNATNQMTKQQSLFDANVKASLAQIDNEAQLDRQSQAVYGTLSDHFAGAISDINKDTNMNQQSKDYAIKQLYDTYKAQISMLSAVGSVPDVSALLQADFVTTQNDPQALKYNALGRKSAKQKPTQQDVANGFAKYKNGKMVWSV